MTQNTRRSDLKTKLEGFGYLDPEIISFFNNPDRSPITQVIRFMEGGKEIYEGALALLQGQSTSENIATTQTIHEMDDERYKQYQDFEEPKAPPLLMNTPRTAPLALEGLEAIVEEIDFLTESRKNITLDDIYSVYCPKGGLLYEVFADAKSYLTLGKDLTYKIRSHETENSTSLGRATVDFLKDQEKKGRIARKDYGYCETEPEKKLDEPSKVKIVMLADEISSPVMSYIKSVRLPQTASQIQAMSEGDRKEAILKGVLIYLANNGLETRYFSADEIRKLGQ